MPLGLILEDLPYEYMRILICNNGMNTVYDLLSELMLVYGYGGLLEFPELMH